MGNRTEDQEGIHLIGPQKTKTCQQPLPESKFCIEDLFLGKNAIIILPWTVPLNSNLRRFLQLIERTRRISILLDRSAAKDPRAGCSCFQLLWEWVAAPKSKSSIWRMD